MPSPSKNKGSSWEREIAVYLSELYNESFIRAPGSGAYIGGANTHRKQLLDEGKIRTFKGDIVPGENFQLLNIEAKFYKDFPFHQMYTGSCKILDEWIEQLMAPADPNDINLLALKFNRKGKFIGFEVKHIPTLNTGTHYTRYHHGKHGPWAFMDFETFWQTNKDSIRNLHQAPQANI